MYTIDTSVFINATEPHEPDYAASRQFLGAVYAQRIPMIEPTLVLAEIAGTASRMRSAQHAQRLETLLRRFRTLRLVPLDDALAIRAAALARSHRLRGADAVYAAVAQHFHTTLVSRDAEHLTRLVGVVPVVHPAAAGIS